MPDIKLFPCPICGCDVCALQTEPRLYNAETHYEGLGWNIWCGECNMLWGFEYDYGGIYRTEEQAAKAWNEVVTNHG